MRRVLVSLMALVGLITVGLVTAPSTVAGASAGSRIYDSTLSPLPGNQVSEAFEATQTTQFGNQIAFKPEHWPGTDQRRGQPQQLGMRPERELERRQLLNHPGDDLR